MELLLKKDEYVCACVEEAMRNDRIEEERLGEKRKREKCGKEDRVWEWIKKTRRQRKETFRNGNFARTSLCWM
jgi:hypothetical protein